MKLFSKIRTCSLLWAMWLLALPAIGATSPEKPEDYASSAKIVTPGSSSHYHLSIPFVVYAGSKTPTLDDLRVFNADGELVPHALVMPNRTLKNEQRTQNLDWFPLFDNRPENIRDDIIIERNAVGSVVSIKSGQVKSDAPVQEVLLNLKSFDWPLAALKIETRGGQAMQHFSLQASDDLKNWRSILNNGVLARLDHDGRQLVQDDVNLPSIKTNYLKITWAKQESVPEVLNIQATFSQSQAERLPFLWSDPIAPRSQPDEDGVLTYSWQNALPIEKVDVLLPETNTLSQVRLLSLTAPLAIQQPHRSLARGLLNPPEPKKLRPVILAGALIYRLDNNGEEARSTQIALSSSPIEGFSLVAEKNTRTVLTKAPPSVRIGFTPRQLVFLASGKSPYTLAWGKIDGKSNALPMSTIAPQHRDDSTLPGLMATLENIQAASTLPLPKETLPEKNDYRWLLWGILVAGVILLLGMAWKLIKN